MREQNEKFYNKNNKIETIKQNKTKTKKPVILEPKVTKTELMNSLESRPDHAEESVKSTREAPLPPQKKIKSKESLWTYGAAK